MSNSNDKDHPQQQPPVAHVPDEVLLEPHRYINSVPGKNVRGKLVDCFQQWLQAPPQVLAEIKDIIGDLHNASLLIDDIEDNSKLRRGVPVAHSIFGVPATINCANYVYFLALQKCHALQNEKAMNVFVNEMLCLHRGQGYDISWRDRIHCPTQEEYCNMVKDKTGGLFRLAVGLMQAFSNNCDEQDFTELVNNLALYFQIRDDLINVADEEYFKSKSFCEDLTEGKFSFPIIHCISQTKTDDSSSQLLHILKQRTDDVEVKRYAQRLMREAGSLLVTRTKCKELVTIITKQIDAFGGNPSLLKLLKMLDVQLDGIEDEHLQPASGRHVVDSA